MKNIKVIILGILMGITASAGGVSAAWAESFGTVQVMSARYGGRNDVSPRDFTAGLQQSCGESSTYCEVFCSEPYIGRALRGHYLRHPLCRVVYRCGSQTTQTAEARKNETIVLSCRARQY